MISSQVAVTFAEFRRYRSLYIKAARCGDLYNRGYYCGRLHGCIDVCFLLGRHDAAIKLSGVLRRATEMVSNEQST